MFGNFVLIILFFLAPAAVAGAQSQPTDEPTASSLQLLQDKICLDHFQIAALEKTLAELNQDKSKAAIAKGRESTLKTRLKEFQRELKKDLVAYSRDTNKKFDFSICPAHFELEEGQ
jgi:hypothetical protein